MNDARNQALALLADGKSYAETARTVGLSYGQVYSLAMKNGVVRARAEERWAREAEKERQRRADEARYQSLLEAYDRGELVDDKDIAARVYEAMMLSGRRVPELEHLDTLAFLRSNFLTETAESS